MVEDCGGLERLDEIRERFGEPVAEIVDACTDSYEQPKPDRSDFALDSTEDETDIS